MTDIKSVTEIEYVIKIPEETYKATCNGSMLPPDVANVVNAIKNATPLPKDHNKAIRADAITECLQIVQKIKDDYNEARFGEQIPINYGTLCGIIIAFEKLKEQKNDNKS